MPNIIDIFFSTLQHNCEYIDMALSSHTHRFETLNYFDKTAKDERMKNLKKKGVVVMMTTAYFIILI